METKTRLRQAALEAAVKISQYDRNVSAYDIISEADRYFEWLIKDEPNYEAVAQPFIGNNVDDEIPF